MTNSGGTVAKYFPAVSWLRAYPRRWLRGDLIAGLTVWGMRAARRPGEWLVAGVVGVLGGLAIVSHSLFSSLVASGMMVNLFAVVAILTGVLHLRADTRFNVITGTNGHGAAFSWERCRSSWGC